MNKKLKSGTILTDTRLFKNDVVYSQKNNVYVSINLPKAEFGEEKIKIPYDFSIGSNIPVMLNGFDGNNRNGYIISTVNNGQFEIVKGLIIPNLHIVSETRNGYLLRSDFNDKQIFFSENLNTNFKRFNGLVTKINDEFDNLRPEIIPIIGLNNSVSKKNYQRLLAHYK